MTEAEQRTPEELIVRYEFEPTLKDLYVEGSDDKIILEDFFEKNEIEDVKIFEISTVNIPEVEGNENSNRTRLKTLAEILFHELSDDNKVFCLIDSDFDCLAGFKEINPKLLATDYANMEMYFFTGSTIKNINRHCLKKYKITKPIKDDFIVPMLTDLFLVRYVNSKRKWHLTYLNFEKIIKYDKGKFSFDTDLYIKRYLNKNGRLAELNNFKDEIALVKLNEKSDARCYIHGHDFLELICIIINKFLRKKTIYTPEIIYNFLKVSADYNDFAKEPLFSFLLRAMR